MAIQTMKATMQMRRGLEEDFDASSLLVGEWALSTDMQWVRICYAPGHVMKIATQETMDETLAEIELIMEATEGFRNDAEAYAVGEREGQDVPSTDPTYHNNSKYYSQQSSNSASTASTGATQATNAASAAVDSSEDSEAWAKGTRNGSPVPSTDPAYNNSSKYWAEHAVQSFANLNDVELSNVQNGQVPVYDSTTQKWKNGNASGSSGVSSFNGRSGAVTPAQDDYTIGQIKATGTQGQVPTLNAQGKLEMATPTPGGVSSFNGRTGAVTPASGDYDADQIDYDPTDSGLTATDVQEAIDELANRPSGGVTSFNGRSGAVVPTASDYDADQIDYDNSGSDLSSTNVNDAIDEVSTKISGYWTSTVNALVGDTTVTITDSAIKTTSVVEAYSQNASGSVTPIDGITVTNGQAVIRMPALTEATTFKLWIDENKAPSGGDNIKYKQVLCTTSASSSYTPWGAFGSVNVTGATTIVSATIASSSGVYGNLSINGTTVNAYTASAGTFGINIAYIE